MRGEQIGCIHFFSLSSELHGCLSKGLLRLLDLVYLQKKSVRHCYYGFLLTSQRPAPEFIPQWRFL